MCSLERNEIGAAGVAAIASSLVHLPQLQALRSVVRPAVCGVVYTGIRGNGLRAHWCCCVCALCSRSLGGNEIHGESRAAPDLRALMRAASGRRLEGFVRGMGVTKKEEDREASSVYTKGGVGWGRVG